VILLDANVIIHYFLDDVPEQTLKAEALLSSGQLLLIPDVVFTEVEYVLRKQYEVPKSEFLRISSVLLSHTEIEVSAIARRALGLFRVSSLSLADCLLIEMGRGHTIASFDAQLIRHCESAYWQS